MIDKDGYRPNVGIVVINNSNQVLFAKRKNQSMWQFPQGGIDNNEDDIEACYRELDEEVGLKKADVTILAKTPKWLRYNLPDIHKSKDNFIGQKQVWFLLKINCNDNNIKLDKHFDIEFDDWEWVDYWKPIAEVINFKRAVYEDMLKSFAPVVFANKHIIPKNLTRPLSCSAIIL